MIKLMFLMKRKDGLSFDAFKKWLVEEHVVFARELPGLKKYTVNPLFEEDPSALYDAITALHFESASAMNDAFASTAGEAAGADVAVHCASTPRMICEEQLLV